MYGLTVHSEIIEASNRFEAQKKAWDNALSQMPAGCEIVEMHIKRIRE
jgi:hypothetical protein